MAYYRILRALSTGHRPGDPPVEGSTFRPDILEKLLAVKALAPVASPPLSELPGWTRRAEKLAEVGINTVEELLAADLSTIAEVFKHKTDRPATRYKEEVMNWIQPPKPKRGG